MCMQNLKSVALTVPEIIGGNQKIWAVPGYAHAPFSLKCLMGFYSDGPSECTGQNLKSVAFPVHELTEGTRKFWAVPGYTHAPFSPKIFNGLLFGCTL